MFLQEVCHRLHPVYRLVVPSILILLIGITVSACDLFAQDELVVMHYADVEQKPAPGGGFEALAASAKYPEIARKALVEGKVLVRVVIDEQGKVVPSHPRGYGVMLGIEAGCDEEALRVIRNAQYTPGRHQGRPVPVKMCIALHFDYRGPRFSAESCSDIFDYTDVETKPVPERGFEFLASSVKCSVAARQAAEGIVRSYILIDKQGWIYRGKVNRYVGAECREEAQRVVNEAKYIPGRYEGERVPVYMCVASTFDAQGTVSMGLCEDQP